MQCRVREGGRMPHRVALIGCGKIGSELADDVRADGAGVNTHAGAYRACPRTELIAVCDLNPARAERCERRWNVPAWYTDPIRLLDEQRPTIVSVCTPDQTHADVVRAALLTEGVKAILAEKPLALTAPKPRSSSPWRISAGASWRSTTPGGAREPHRPVPAPPLGRPRLGAARSRRLHEGRTSQRNALVRPRPVPAR